MIRTRSILLGLAVVGAAACASSAVEPDAPQGVPTDVEVLDAAFVRFEGQRVAVEWFLLEMRERVRAADGDLARLPWVRVTIAPDAASVDGRWVSALRNELYKAGVRNLTLGSA